MGGIDVLSEAQFSLIKRAAAIEVELELSEGKMSMGEDVDLDIFTRSASHLRRIFETLGVERRPKDVTPPHLRQYLHARAVAVDDAGLTGDRNVTGPSPTSSSAGNRTGEAPARDLRPLEGDQDGTG
jgi:hypothetical protein